MTTNSTNEPPAGELNDTQAYYTRTIGRQRADLIEVDAERRLFNDTEFNARVRTVSGLLSTGSRSLDRLLKFQIAIALHLDDVVMGRWQRSTVPVHVRRSLL